MPSYPGGVGLMIGVPWDGKPTCLPWSFALQNLHPPMNYDVRWQVVPGKPVAQARNEILASAIQQKCRYLFFLGTDNSGPAFGLQQLIFDMENFRDKGFAVAGGIYCHKSPPQMPMVFRGNGIGPYMDWKVGEVFECSGLGMDFTLLDVEKVAALPQPWFQTIENLDQFRDGVMHGEAWTEDLYFCKKVTDAGLRILANGGVLVDHWDNMTATPYRMDPRSKPMQALRLPKGEKKIVDLGCGPEEDSYVTPEGPVVRVDIRDEVKPDYRCDLRTLPFKTGEFDVVFSSHTLEHFSRTEVDQLMKEWTRILKEDGEMRLVLPNIEWAARHILNGEVDADVINVLYGAQTYAENFHKMGYTPQMLEQLLRKWGFTFFKWDLDRYHMVVRAWKKEPERYPDKCPGSQQKNEPVVQKVVELPKEEETEALEVQVQPRVELPTGDKVDNMQVEAEVKLGEQS